MNFINKIQHRLLLNYPLIWSSRIVPVIIIAGTINIVLFFLFYVFSSATRSDSFMAWIPFLSLSSIIGIIVYLIYLLRFNHFKIFGKLRWTDFFFQFVLFFIALGSIISWPFIPSIASHIATSKSFSIEEMRVDLEEAFILANQLEYTKETVPYRRILIEINDSISEIEYDEANNQRTLPSKSDLDESAYVKIEKKSDNTYIGYERVSMICGTFPYGLTSTEYIDDQIYKSIPDEITNVEEKQKRLNNIFEKYIPDYDGSIYKTASSFVYQDYYYSEPSGGYNNKVCEKYRLSEMCSYMNAYESEIFSDDDWEVAGRMWFYMTLYSSLFLLIYRFMSRKTFLWTLLFTFLLFVLSVIITISSNFRDNGILGMMFIYYLTFVVVASTIFLTKSRNVFQGIALNLSFFCLPLFPMVAVSFFYRLFNDSNAPDYYFEILEVSGIVLVIISSLFVHNRLFYKWFSLPEE